MTAHATRGSQPRPNEAWLITLVLIIGERDQHAFRSRRGIE